MPEKEQQDRTLSELVVKEAVEKGLDTPLRESILEAVEESEGSPKGRRLPLVGAVFGLGAALGFLAGQQSSELETPSLEDVEEPEIIEDVGEVEETTETEDVEPEADAESEGSSSRLPRLLLALGVIAAAVFLRRRMGGEEEDEWEPIEEFEPATSIDSDEEEGEQEEAEAEAGEDEDDEEE